jgi:23S rRNA (adenine2030-N6)-methyltransferase
MNYRHAYHAGNFADVHKHAALTLLMAHLRRKDTPFHVLDTHAGIGRYDLESVEAGKTREWEGGIGRIIARNDAVLRDYLDLVRGENRLLELRHYPGSPLILRKLLRPIDRMTLVELHPEDAASLRALFRRDRQVAIREEDAYQALKASLPPKERRGLVLIDPPYEERDEMRSLARGLAEALRRFPTGNYAIWYPIKSPAEVAKLKAELANLGRPCLASELMLFECDDESRLNGSGLALVNPPWQLDGLLAALTNCLHEALGCRGRTAMQWLAKE